MKNKQAFTLIELLVVVLIIGILAAVAVPQYKLAVTKARVSAILPVVKSMADAEEVYYMANGTYTKDARELDLEMPDACPGAPTGKWWKCNYFGIDIGTGDKTILANYCPGNTNLADNCFNTRDFQIVFYLSQHPTKPGTQDCTVRNNSSLGTKICGTLFK